VVTSLQASGGVTMARVPSLGACIVVHEYRTLDVAVTSRRSSLQAPY